MTRPQTDDLLPYDGASVTRIELILEPPLTRDYTCLGIDPGPVNMGVACLYGQRHARLFEIQLPSPENSIDRILNVTGLMQYLFSLLPPKLSVVCTEGAAYLAPHGQVPLETARTTATIAALQAGAWPAYIVPPKEIREWVFLNGKLRTQEVWPELPENAGSALGCALYAYLRLKKEGLSK